MVFFKNKLGDPCKRRDRKATELAIRETASKLFAEKGYENTRTLEIAKLSGANEALITRYFGGKEGLLIAIMKDDSHFAQKDPCDRFDVFPNHLEVPDFGQAIEKFFKDGLQAFELKQDFVKIGASRAILDPEMAEIVRKKVLQDNLPDVLKAMQTYPTLARLKKSEIEAMALLLMAVNFNMNFMGRRIYKMGDAQVDQALKLLAMSFVSYLGKESKA